jgi:hypothetical protein
MGVGGQRAGSPVRVASTGGDAELVEIIPITRRRAAGRRVAMRLGPSRRRFASLPDLAPGDRIEVLAEVEVTTDAPRRPGRVGKPYAYEPTVEAQLLLSGDPGATAADGRHALALPKAISETCTHRQHHRVLVFAGAGLQIPAGGLPWPGPSYLNLVLGAHHPDAVRDQVLLVGENEPDGTVLGDKGRISVVRLRPGSQPRPRPKRSGPSAVSEVAVQKGRLDDLSEGEQLVVTASLKTSAAQLGYPARISTRLFLADDPAQESPGGEAQTVAAFRGVITASNGFNCLPKNAHCTTQKAGVAYLREAPSGPLYVNLVAVSADPFGGAGRGDALEVLGGGGIEVVRYPPT